MCVCVWLTDEICLAGVDGVLQLVGGDTELVLWRPVDSDGVMGGGAQLVSYGWRVWSYVWRKKKKHDPSQTKVINRGYYKVKNIGAKEKEWQIYTLTC